MNNITILFKDSTTVTIRHAYQVVNDGELLTINYEECVDDEGYKVMTTDSATFALDDIALITNYEI